MASDDDPARPTTGGDEVARPAVHGDDTAGSPGTSQRGWRPAAAADTRPAGTEVRTRDRDGRSWQNGTAAGVEWITRGTASGLTVTSAIPPVFESYATAVVPEFGAVLDEHERRVIGLLADHSSDKEWWLGYLDTGASDIVFPDVPRVRLYSDWPYVLVKAGPQQALTWRAQPSPLHCGLPDLMFPTDHSWLISALWDDDWWCLGGSKQLIDAFLREPGLESRRVAPDDGATPPGHAAR